jgi:hypothetical protein
MCGIKYDWGLEVGSEAFVPTEPHQLMRWNLTTRSPMLGSWNRGVSHSKNCILHRWNSGSTMTFWHNPLGSIIKIVCSATLVGSLGGFVFPLLLRMFSIDQSLSLWELLVSFVIAILILNIFAFLLSTRIMILPQTLSMYRLNHFFSPVQCKFVGIPGALTLIIPLLGPLFGGTGKEPFWAFLILGIVGCLFWSIPLFVWFLISLLIKK